MPSELSRRLDDFRTKNKVVSAVQKVSFLFDPTRAAGMDILSMALIAKQSLLNLSVCEPSLALFEDMFEGTGKSVDFMSQEEHAETQTRMKHLLMFLSGHFRTLDAQQCVEYLIQKYQIHVYNGEDLILLGLPYHDTPQFGSLVKLISFIKKADRATASESRWMFLRNVQKTGSPLSRLALVKMCRSSQPVLSAIMEHVVESLRHGAYNLPLLSFVNVLLLEVLSEFPQIKFDISVSLFSLCRVCFKAASLCPPAFFLGLSLATHIVCVADVRDDALGILVSRAIKTCPSEKIGSLLMSLLVIASRRVALPESVLAALNSIEPSLVEIGVKECVAKYKADMSVLVSRLGSSGLAGLIQAASEEVISIPVTTAAASPAPVLVTPMDEEVSSSSSSEEEEDQLSAARKVLNKLVAKGTKKERLEAVRKYCSLEGATRHCIRLSALCDSVEALALTMKSNRSDQGFVEVLISVLPQFSAGPHLLLEAVFGNEAKIVQGSLKQIAGALTTSCAASLLAVARGVDTEFTLTAQVWQALAVVAAGSGSQIGQSGLLVSWRSEFLPNNFLSQYLSTRAQTTVFINRCIEFANAAKSCGGDPVGAALGQLVCSVAISHSGTRRALNGLVQKSVLELSISDRTQFVAAIAKSQFPSLLKQTTCLNLGPLDLENGEFVSAAEALMTIGSVDGWGLIGALIAGCGYCPNGALLVAQLGANLPAPVAVCAWKTTAAWAKQASENDSHTVGAIIELASAGLQAAAELTTTVSAQMEALEIVSDLSAPPVDVSAAAIARILRFSMRVGEAASDTLTVSAQAVCESLLRGIPDLETCWTLILRLMGGEAENVLALQIRCLVLFNAVLAREDADPEQLASKQLGQVLLGLVELVSSSSGRETAIDSWVNLSNSQEELGVLVEEGLVQFLLNCNLRKLDRMFRKLVHAAAENVAKTALVLRVFAAVCQQGGSAATLALLPLFSDEIRAALTGWGDTKLTKRKRNADLIIASLRAVAAACVEEIPEVSLSEFIAAVASVPGTIDDGSVLAEACIALARVASTDQTKTLTKLLMGRSVDKSSPAQQEQIVRTMLALWQKIGEAMVPAITEVTVFLNELYHSDVAEVASATRRLVAEMDRITGENIGQKLEGK